MIYFLTENTNKYDYMPNNWAARKKNVDRNKNITTNCVLYNCQ